MDRAGGSLNARTAIVTGAGRGIGTVIARALIARGLRVGLVDIDADSLAKAVVDTGAPCARTADVSDPDSLRAAVDAIEAEIGPVDVFVNNAGIMPVGPIEAESDATTGRVLGVNVVGVVVGTKRALETMLPRRRGHIVNVASMGSDGAVAGGATYCASKAAVARFTDAVRLEVRTRGVKCTTIYPSFVRTELISGMKPSRAIRIVEPDDVAAAVVRVLDRPKAHVYVPRSAGVLLKLQALLPRAVAEPTGRAFGAERVFLDGVDTSARAAYEARVRGS